MPSPAFYGLRRAGEGGFAVGGFFFGDDSGDGDEFVGVVESQEADALRRPAHLAEFAGHADAHHLPVLRDHHEFVAVADGLHADDRAVAIGGLDVDHALSAAVGEAVFLDGGSFAVAVFAGDQHGDLVFAGFLAVSHHDHVAD